MKNKPKIKLNGFTLVDTLIGIALLGVAVMIFSLFLPGLKLVTAAKSEAVAISIAQQKIEELRTIPFGALEVQEQTPFTHPQLSRLANGEAFFSIGYFDANDDGQVNENIKLVEVFINWSASSGQSEVFLASLITETGFNRLE